MWPLNVAILFLLGKPVVNQVGTSPVTPTDSLIVLKCLC